jgi:leader peptidase (prepilin peptidase) / N-methyltransferase
MGNMNKESKAPSPKDDLVSTTTAGPMGAWGHGLSEPSVTAKADVMTALGASVTGRFGASWSLLGPRGRVVAIGAAVAGAAAAGSWLADTANAVATGLSMLVLTAAALVDAVEHRLPNALVGAAAVPVILALAIAWVTGSTDVVWGGLVGAALVGGPLLVAHLISPVGMGFGDVKAGAVLGAALGLINAQIAVLALMLGLLGSAVWALSGRRRSVALGPGLVGGAVVALFVARLLYMEAAG